MMCLLYIHIHIYLYVYAYTFIYTDSESGFENGEMSIKHLYQKCQ